MNVSQTSTSQGWAKTNCRSGPNQLAKRRSSNAIVLDDWERSLGRLETEAFRNSGLVITAQRHRSVIATPRDAKAARTAPSLERRVRLFHNALVLLGCAYNRRALIVQGNTYGSSEHLGPISTGLPVSHSLGYRRLRRITAADLERAATMLLSLEHVYRHAPRPLYRRIRKGFNCWIHAVWNTDLGEKLHFFVRSIEAITRAASGQRTPRGSTPRSITAMFRERAQTFAGQSKQSIRTIDQFYVLRSAVEHVYDVMPRLRKPSGISRDESVRLPHTSGRNRSEHSLLAYLHE